ncbi:MAG: B12-binding domain-containing protein [Acidimicrobiales bacterium]
MDDPLAGKLDLQMAADALGVHYQTAYRWVRTGRLEAEMIGGRYVVSRGDIELLDRQRQLPSPPPAPRTKRLATASERMYQALLTGDEAAAAKLAKRLVGEGAAVHDLIDEVLVPPMRRLGEAWSSGEVTIWTEHARPPLSSAFWASLRQTLVVGGGARRWSQPLRTTTTPCQPPWRPTRCGPTTGTYTTWEPTFRPRRSWPSAATVTLMLSS